jgi:hypothetical protein
LPRALDGFDKLLLGLRQGLSEDLLLDINREATRRMISLVAPQAAEPHGPELLRLSMGNLFEEARILPPSLSSPGKGLSPVYVLTCSF